MESKWTMEVVLETVKLRTTNSVYDNDEVLLPTHVLSLCVNGVLFRIGSNYVVLVHVFPKRGAVRDVCDWVGRESCVFVLLVVDGNLTDSQQYILMLLILGIDRSKLHF